MMQQSLLLSSRRKDWKEFCRLVWYYEICVKIKFIALDKFGITIEINKFKKRFEMRTWFCILLKILPHKVEEI